MNLDRVHIGEIKPNPDRNPRKIIRGIGKLADSIEEVGLLENLVVSKQSGSYVVRAGERRRRAVQQLFDEGRHDGYVHCLIIDSDGEFEALAENEGRMAVLPWETGDRLNELSEEKGYTQQEIAKKIGSTQQKVSQYQTIAKGMGTKARQVLSRMPAAVTLRQLFEISSLVDQDGKPDDSAQIRKIDDILSKPRKRKRRKRRDLEGLSLRELLFVRYRSLKYHVSVPVEARSQVNAVLRFLDGSDKHLDLSAWGLEKF